MFQAFHKIFQFSKVLHFSFSVSLMSHILFPGYLDNNHCPHSWLKYQNCRKLLFSTLLSFRILFSWFLCSTLYSTPFSSTLLYSDKLHFTPHYSSKSISFHFNSIQFKLEIESTSLSFPLQIPINGTQIQTF